MIISFLIGLVIGILIMKLILRKYNIQYKGPNSNDIKKNYYKYNDKYYRFTTEICFCPLC